MTTLFSLKPFPFLLFASTATLALVIKAHTWHVKRISTRPFKYIALDLDGTTLNSKHVLTQTTVDTIRRMSAKGIQIFIATGRSLGSVMDTLNHLELGVEVPVVCLNGAMCIKVSADVKSFETIFDASVPPTSADKLLAFAAKRGWVAQYYIESKVYAAPKTGEHKQLLERYSVLTGKKQAIVPDYSDPVSIAPAAKILLMTNNPDDMMTEFFKTDFSDEFHVIKGSPYPFFVEFLAPGINKGSGLQRMCSLMQYNIEEVVAFGDGENDKEFLQCAGLGVAMSNASALAKFAADVVNPWSNDEDGVSLYLGQLEKRGVL